MTMTQMPLQHPCVWLMFGLCCCPTMCSLTGRWPVVSFDWPPVLQFTWVTPFQRACPDISVQSKLIAYKGDLSYRCVVHNVGCFHSLVPVSCCGQAWSLVSTCCHFEALCATFYLFTWRDTKSWSLPQVLVRKREVTDPKEEIGKNSG